MDVLDLLTAPLFAQPGQVSPFAALSGRGQLDAALRASTARTERLLAGGVDPLEASFPAVDVQRLLGPLVAFAPEPPVVRLYGPGRGGVPEPAAVILMLISLPALFRRPRTP